ncbi:MAG: esterase family protein [Planctomycetales bacterium]|nr:esterase family protein [Planctomycetales bacterium]
MRFCLASLVFLVACQETPSQGENQKGSQPSSQVSLETVTVSDAKPDLSGFLVHEVTSPYQAGKTSIRVLLPDARKPDSKSSVIYVLPVEAGTESRYGDGLAEIKKLDLHNKHGVIFVAPTFSHLPWYADHPDKPEIRQEAYLLKVVVPVVEKTYPAQPAADHRLLLGFSKSGWGAWSLLLRHPDVFGKAAAWDAPMMMDKPGKYGSGEIFGTQENFAKYRIETLLRTKGKDLGKDERLILTGYGGFREEHVRVQDLMTGLKIPHVYKDGPQRKHDWHSGWVGESVELLVQNEKRP